MVLFLEEVMKSNHDESVEQVGDVRGGDAALAFLYHCWLV